MTDEKRCDRCQHWHWTFNPAMGRCLEPRNVELGHFTECAASAHCGNFERRDQNREPSAERRKAWRGIE